MMIRDAVGDEAGVLVIRVWREPDAEKPFRARITYGGERETAASTPTSDPDDVVEAVRRWLAERARDQPKP